METLGQRIFKIRDKLGHSQAKFAEVIGVGGASVRERIIELLNSK